jgi:hypothetical protein
MESFEVEKVEMAEFFLGCLVRNRLSNYKFWFLSIYGPAQHDRSDDFILELSSFCANKVLPILMGGDFNLVRNNKDRNQGQGDPRLMNLFNEFIGTYQLRDIFVSGVKYTWSNKQRNPTLIKLDRILASSSWDLNYSRSFAWSKARIGSDHSPLILDTGEHGAPRTKYFFFEEKWCHHEGFYDLLRSKWEEFRVNQREGAYSLDIWHGCLQSLRKYVRGWSLRIAGHQKEIVRGISSRIEEIDVLAEKKLLTMDEWEERIDLEENLDRINTIEELQWKQKAGKNWILRGDANTQFFHQFVNGRRRKKTITILESVNGEVRGQDAISVHIVDFYKGLFGHNEPCYMSLNPNFWPKEFCIPELDKIDLVKPFSMEEIREVVFDMKENSALGPNGYGVFFSRNFGIF